MIKNQLLYRKSIEEAVSPVVGVMLMLVVTIIIAAIISGFAGGITSETDRVPTVQIRGTFSNSEGMTIEHMGGDTLAVDDILLYVRPSNTYGDVAHLVSIVNKSIIVDASGTPWTKDKGSSGAKSFGPGDTHYILPPNHEASHLQSELGSSAAYYSIYGDSNVGKTFFIELATENGKIFATDEVTVTP